MQIKKLKGQNISITKSLTKTRMGKLKQAKETYGFINVLTNNGTILFQSDHNASLSYESFGGLFHMPGDL